MQGRSGEEGALLSLLGSALSALCSKDVQRPETHPGSWPSPHFMGLASSHTASALSHPEAEFWLNFPKISLLFSLLPGISIFVSLTAEWIPL